LLFSSLIIAIWTTPLPYLHCHDTTATTRLGPCPICVNVDGGASVASMRSWRCVVLLMCTAC